REDIIARSLPESGGGDADVPRRPTDGADDVGLVLHGLRIGPVLLDDRGRPRRRERGVVRHLDAEAAREAEPRRVREVARALGDAREGARAGSSAPPRRRRRGKPNPGVSEKSTGRAGPSRTSSIGTERPRSTWTHAMASGVGWIAE